MPDWKNDADYRFTKKLDRRGWAWEFMRRNRKYRDDFNKLDKAWKAVPKKGHFYRSVKAEKADHLGRKLGLKWRQLGYMANPAFNAVPEFITAGPIEPDAEQIAAFYSTSRSRSLRP